MVLNSSQFFFLLIDTHTRPLQIHLAERSQVEGARSHVKGLIKQCRAWNSSTSLCYSIHNTWPTIKDHHSQERKTWFGTLVIPGRKSNNLYFRSSLVKAKHLCCPKWVFKDSFLFTSLLFNLGFKRIINLSSGQSFCLLCVGCEESHVFFTSDIAYCSVKS